MHHVAAVAVHLRPAVIAVTHVVMVVDARRQSVAVMIAVHVHVGMVAVIVPAMAVIAAPNPDRSLLVIPGRREVAGTRVGRALLGIIILVHRRAGVAILRFRIGQLLMR